MARGFRGWTSKSLKNKVSANALTKSILRFLSMNGWFVWRQNNIPVFDITSASKALAGKNITSQKQANQMLRQHFRKNSVMKGVADIIGFNLKDGRFIAVEVKVGGDKTSHEQEIFLTTVKRAGGIALIARDFDQFFESYKQEL